MGFDAMYRRENIILNAIELLNEYGVHSVSTKEISKRMGISEGTVFKYFPKKNDLMYAVLERFSQYDNDIFYSAKERNPGTIEPILFYIDSYLIYYESYPAITTLVQAYDLLRRIPELEEKVNAIFSNRINFMKELVESAQDNGVLSKDLDSDSLATIFSSTCGGICLKWRMSNFDFSLRKRTIETINGLIHAFSNNI